MPTNFQHWLQKHRLLSMSLLFALGYALEPLYTPNQCVRFIFGIKKSGVGYLANDWFSRRCQVFS